MTTIPDWLAQRITIATGAELGATWCRAEVCRCGQPVIVGLDDDRGAHRARVDPYALGAQGEALALLAGRSTAALFRRAGHWQLRHRDRWQIAGTPAGSPRRFGVADIVAEHVCGADPLPAIASVHSKTSPTDESVPA